MKWLKIKKYLKIFSVIICSIFILSNKAYASDEYLYFNNNQYKEIIHNNLKDTSYIEEFNNLINYLNNNSPYKYVLWVSLRKVWNTIPDDIHFKISYFKNSESIDNGLYISKYNSDGFAIGFRVKNYGVKDFNYYTGNINDNNLKEYIEKAKNDLSILIKDNTWNNYRAVSSIGFFENIDNKKVIKNESLLPIYTNLENLKFINEPNNWGNYNVILEDNNMFGYEILNSSVNEFINSYSFLNEKENPLIYRMQFNNDVSPDLKQITFDFSSYEFTEGSNPVKTKIEMGSNSLLAEEIPNYLNSYIYGYGTDGIKYDMSEYIDFTINNTNYLTTKELTFTYTLKKDLPEDILRIYVYYDFETSNNNYFFNVFDNATWGSVFWNYIENFLVGYKKYTFPDGYDLAIIRSKDFIDLDSFYISDKVYFTNPDYNFNLKLYDFNNKIEKYNFNSLTQYLINDVYLKIPIKIDETNNIFPVLTRPLDNESGVFYLKEDLFVQFVNSNSLDSIIENIPEEDFNNNNDLILEEDIKDINPPEKQEESLTVFFNQFWKMFEKFSDIFSYITACFTQFFISLPTTIQFFLCISFAFVIYKMLVFFIL